ncbi:MAG: alpha/beta fold hydrolase [Chloroflexota bacterium]|nr:alpha/beta fold hydrolase [Chloroflexota bacterium]MDE2907613.1 alpha/beta fold hydrolase [Chloroflexota bacterium]
MRLRFCFAALILLLTPAAVGAQAAFAAASCANPPFGFTTNCGYLRLPQDYDKPDEGNIAIYFIQVKAKNHPSKSDPLVYLVGGPGSSGSQLLPVSFRKYLRAFADERDIIIIDQRGTGESAPRLYCREAWDQLADILQSHHAEHAELLLEILAACHQRLTRAGVQFASYHSDNIARDIVNVLRALGYERWNLVGVSYGSRLALAMMRDYPETIRSVILDSVYPPQADIYIDAYYHGERAMQALFAACAHSERCNARYPNLEAVFRALYEGLNQTPMIATYKPPRFQTLKIEISGYRLYDWVFSWLYEVNSIQQIPKLIYDLDRGFTQSAVGLGVAFEANMTSLSLGMHYTVQCQEEYDSALNRDYYSMVEAHPHLGGYLRYPVEGVGTLSRLCGLWQAEPRPLAVNDPVASDIPALLLSGNYDPITPPAYADMASETLTTAYNIVLPHVGHGVLRSHRCAVDIALEFINAPQSEPDSGCIAQTQPIAFE